MPGQRSAQRRFRGNQRRWAAAAAVVALSVGAGVIIAISHTTQSQAVRSSASVSRAPGGRGGVVMRPGPGQGVVPITTNTGPRHVRETKAQFLASYDRIHAQEYRAYLREKNSLKKAYQSSLSRWRKGHGHGRGQMPPPPTTTSAPTAPATTAPPTTAPTTTPTATTTPTTTPTASPTATIAAGVTQATSTTWAGYAMTGAAGTFTSVASSWMVPTLSCNAVNNATTKSSLAVGLDGDGSTTTEQVGTEGDCNGDIPLYSGWYEVTANDPVFFANTVKPGDVMAATVTSLGGGNFMFTLFDMTQNWTQTTEQTSATATLSSGEIVAEDPTVDGAAQPLSNFGLVDFLGSAINNAAITTPIDEITMVSGAGNTLAVPSTITGGVGNFSVGWDAAA